MSPKYEGFEKDRGNHGEDQKIFKKNIRNARHFEFDFKIEFSTIFEVGKSVMSRSVSKI